VLYAEKGNPLHALHRRAHTQGASLILGPDNPVAKRAFANQH
jgi:hypothetical protein